MTKQRNKKKAELKREAKKFVGATKRKGFGWNYFLKEEVETREKERVEGK